MKSIRHKRTAKKHRQNKKKGGNKSKKQTINSLADGDLSDKQMKEYIKDTYVDDETNKKNLNVVTKSINAYLKKNKDNSVIEFINNISKSYYKTNNTDGTDNTYESHTSNETDEKNIKKYEELKEKYSKKNQKCEERYRVNCKKSLNSCTRSTNDNILGKVDLGSCTFDEKLNEELIQSIMYNVDSASQCNTKERPYYKYYRGRGYCSDTMPEISIFEFLIKSNRVLNLGTEAIFTIYNNLPVKFKHFVMNYYNDLVFSKNLVPIVDGMYKGSYSPWDFNNEKGYSNEANLARIIQFKMFIQVIPSVYNGINHFLYKIDEHGLYNGLQLMSKQVITCMKFIPVILIDQIVEVLCKNTLEILKISEEEKTSPVFSPLFFLMRGISSGIYIGHTVSKAYKTVIFDLYKDLMNNTLLSNKYEVEFIGANEELFFRSLLPKYLQGIKPHLYNFIETCMKKTNSKKIDENVNNLYLIFYCLISGVWFGLQHFANMYDSTYEKNENKKKERYNSVICQVVGATVSGIINSYIEHHHNLSTVWMLHFMNNYWATTGGQGKLNSDKFFIE